MKISGRPEIPLSSLSPQTRELIDYSDPGAMLELATRIVSHIPPRLKDQQEQILNFCAAALRGATRPEDLTDILGLPLEEIKTLRDQTKRVLREALAVELDWVNGEKWQIFRERHHLRIDLNDKDPKNW